MDRTRSTYGLERSTAEPMLFSLARDADDGTTDSTGTPSEAVANVQQAANDSGSLYNMQQEAATYNADGVQNGEGSATTTEQATTSAHGVPLDTIQGVDSSVYYLDVKVFLEGVQVPHASAAISYGIDSPPSCTLTIPAASFLRELPETTKVLVIFKDLVADSSGVYQWRVIFDGELSGLGYAINPNGASITLHAIHTTAYLSLMQLMTLDAQQYLYTPQASMLGNMTMATVGGFNKVDSDLIPKIIDGKQYSSMADLVYLIIKYIIVGYKDSSSVSRWYYSKLGDVVGGYKILQRIYGVSDTAKNANVGSWTVEGGGTSSSNLSYGTQSPASQAIPDGYTRRESSTGEPYKIYRVDGEVGTGGNGVNSDAIINSAENRLGTKYVLGGDGSRVSGTDCGQYIKDCWNDAGIEWDSRYVPYMVQEAKEKRVWHEANDGYVPQAGDAIVVGNDMGHIVMSDGKGGNYAASSSQTKTFHFNHTASQYNNQVIGYISANSLLRTKL